MAKNHDIIPIILTRHVLVSTLETSSKWLEATNEINNLIG